MDKEALLQGIDKFFSWYRYRLANVRRLEGLEPSDVNDLRSSFSAEQHILLASGLDALAAAWGKRHGLGKGKHRERMGRFLESHGGPLWSKLSGPDIRFRSKEKYSDRTEKISQIVGNEESTTSIVRTSIKDPTMADFQVRTAALSLDPEWVSQSTYGEILYRYYRNNWIHELELSRHLGDEWVEPGGSDIYYQNYLLSDEAAAAGDQPHRIVFPKALLIQTYEVSLKSFERECREQFVHPCSGQAFPELA
jgi:hypothetical protein